VFGELEFWLSSIKVITLLGMYNFDYLVTFAYGGCTTFRTNNLRYFHRYARGTLVITCSAEGKLT
jgi:amino acid permease